MPYILSQNFTKITAVSRTQSYIFCQKYIVFILRRNRVVLSEPGSNKSGGYPDTRVTRVNTTSNAGNANIIRKSQRLLALDSNCDRRFSNDKGLTHNATNVHFILSGTVCVCV